jgi:prophage regulatory protein
MHPIKSKGDSLTLASNETPRLIRIRSVVALTGLSKSYTYELCNKGLFPKRVQIIAGGTAVGWVRSEVLDWIDCRIKSRDAEDLANVNQ